MNLQATKSRSRENLLIFLGWLMYTTSYLGKVNYSANITQIIDFYGVTKAEAGMATSFFFFAYGIGQVINGLFCKRYNIKWAIFSSMAISAVINITVAVTTDFAVIKWLWMINGIAMSVLWPTLIRMMSEALPRRALSRSSTVLGTTVGTGTLVIYGLSAIYAMFGQFRLAFWTGGVAGAVVAVVWLMLHSRATSMAKAERAEDEPESVRVEAGGAPQQVVGIERKLIFISIAFLCLFSVGINLIKDGLTTWVPSILKDTYHFPDALSILLTLFLPITAIFGNLFALWVHKRVPDYIKHSGLIFGLMGVLILGLIGSMNLGWAVVLLVGMVIVNYLASSLNSLNTSIFPMFMREKVNSGLMAGLLNGFCYVGSTISSYGLGAVADRWGWTAVFWVLCGFCGIAVVAWMVYRIVVRLVKGNTLQ